MNPPASSASSAELPLNSAVLTPSTTQSTPPTLVLLHDWGSSLNTLRPLGELLATSCKVVLVDLPGFGLSALPPEASNDGVGWGTYEYSERVKRFLDESSIESCILVGHSFGGRISVQLASRYPDIIKAVVLIGSHGLKRTRSPIDALRLKGIKLLGSCAKKIDGATGTRIFAHYFSPRFGPADYVAAGDLRKTLVKTVTEDISAQASRIKAPTLLLWGEEDQQTPLDLARSFKALIANCELHIFPDKGHELLSDAGAHVITKHIETYLRMQGLLQ
jgi:pimeloyl-ACP methyl ester carboxylesterase